MLSETEIALHHSQAVNRAAFLTFVNVLILSIQLVKILYIFLEKVPQFDPLCPGQGFRRSSSQRQYDASDQLTVVWGQTLRVVKAQKFDCIARSQPSLKSGRNITNTFFAAGSGDYRRCPPRRRTSARLMQPEYRERKRVARTLGKTESR
jgi:hypothetical protein